MTRWFWKLECYSILRVRTFRRKCSDYSEEDTPVPIPNTVVKLLSADDTWRAASWEIRTSLLFLYGPMVKRLRHRPFTAVTRVRVPVGSPAKGIGRFPFYICGRGGTGRHARFRFLYFGVKVRVLSSAPYMWSNPVTATERATAEMP